MCNLIWSEEDFTECIWELIVMLYDVKKNRFEKIESAYFLFHYLSCHIKFNVFTNILHIIQTTM